MKRSAITKIHNVLSDFRIETPSWGFADTGTRFGKFSQAGSAIDTGDKFADAGQVNAFTGCCPTVAVHILWDFQEGEDPKAVGRLARKNGVSVGSINPNIFQDQHYKYGSFGNPDAKVRQTAVDHVVDSIGIGKAVKSRYVSMWFADGTNYPGQGNIRDRKRWFEECLKLSHRKLAKDQILLVEYKPFEPAFYQTDIADWGMAYLYSKKAGPKAKVLVDIGHHYLAQNVEQIVAFLLDEGMLGGLHLNDRRYADDDLTLGSIDPYQIFRIFHEIHTYAYDTGSYPDIAYMVDQSHNLKPKIEAMIQTVVTAQELYAKAALVDRRQLRSLQKKCDIVGAENLLKDAYATDVRDALASWRKKKKLAEDPLAAFKKSGYTERAAEERTARRKKLGIVQGGSYA
ncbi:MAG: hypothetical protein JKY51_02150 [Opitutaceae bacterium]|nr:hypothetical protein [Opitutaceae bacterium]